MPFDYLDLTNFTESHADASIDRQWEQTKLGLFMSSQGPNGLLASLLCALEFRWTDSIPTAAVSLSTLYFNPTFFFALDVPTRVTVLAHELLHLAFMHHIRMGNRHPKVWNIAGDYVINNFLHECGFVFNTPHLYDPKYKGWLTEDVYDDLMNQVQQSQVNKLSLKVCNGGQGGSQTVQVSVGNGQDEEDDQGEGSAGTEGDLVMKDKDPSGKQVDGTDPSQQASYNAAGLQIAVQAQTAQQMSNQPGKMPGEIALMLNKLLNPKLPWDVLLQNYFEEKSEYEFSYARPHRRYTDPILPSANKQTGLEHILWGFDISGSVSDDQIHACNTELASVKDRFNPETITWALFDTKVRDVIVIEKDDDYPEIEIHGRGGTDLVDLFRLAKELNPSVLCVLTDLWVDIPPDPGMPVLWVILDNEHAKEPPYGRVIYLDTSK